MKRANAGWMIGVVGVGAIGFFALRGGAGPFDPPAGPPGPTMHSLDEIHTLLESVDNSVNGGGASATGYPSDDTLYAGQTPMLVNRRLLVNVDGIEGDAANRSIAGDSMTIGVTNGVNPGQPPFPNNSWSVATVLCDIDKALPLMMLAVANGTAVPTVDITYETAVPAGIDLNWTLTDVRIQTVEPLPHLGKVRYAFSYSEIELEYRSGQDATSFNWNLATGTGGGG